MKLSIWQQFSSNHSGAFTLIGTFESVKEAEHAAAIVRQLLTDIQHWLLANADTPTSPSGYNFITPPEQAFRQQYGELGERCIDWDGLIVHHQSGDAVQSVGNHVLLTTLTESWTDPTNYRGLLDHLGSQRTQRHWDIDGTFLVKVTLNLRGTAPSEVEAVAFETAFNQHLVHPNNNAPWVAIGEHRFQNWAGYWGAEQLYLEGGRCQRQGATVQLSDVTFVSLAHGLPALLVYLQGAGYLDLHHDLIETEIRG